MKTAKSVCFFIVCAQLFLTTPVKAEEQFDFQEKNTLNLIENNIEALCQRKKSSHKSCEEYQLANVGFSVTSPTLWYVINTPSYPDTTPLSLNRNRGTEQGNIVFTDEGLIIGKPGNYFVTFTAIVTNMNPTYTPVIPTFLALNGVFDPNNTATIGAVGTVPFEAITSIQGSGILENVEAGTALSIVATNGGSPQPEPITVIGWGISVFKIAKDPCEKKHRSRHHQCCGNNHFERR